MSTLLRRFGLRKSPQSGDAQPAARWRRRTTWVVTAGLGLLAGGQRASAASPEQNAGPVRSPLLFSCDFESSDWWQAWGQDEPVPRTATVGEDPALQFEPLRGKAMRVEVEAGGHQGLSLAYRFARQIGSEPEEIYFRYYLRFADDWHPERGGKLPGVAGTYGKAGWGGRPSQGLEGWSARGLFTGQKEGRTPIGYYCYHADMPGKYGAHWVWDRKGFSGLENNRWYCIEQHVRMNTPGKRDGVLRGWVDGTLVYAKNDVRMRFNADLKIETVWMNVYYGGTWTAATDYHLYIDDVAISRQPIGPIEAAAAVANPSP